jgi:outer membrane protein OmpA-like peptidoglycan-associated protein
VRGEANVNAEGWGTQGDASVESKDAGLEGDQADHAWRARSLQQQATITGSTGMLRLSEAGSGAPGTFRFSLLTSFFSGSGVLCNSANPCPVLDTQARGTADELDQVTAHLGLSATILPFLEGYVGFHNKATSDSRGRPRLLQVLGDTNLGLKGFMPAEPDRIFSFGGELELWLLNGSGQVGLDGGGTSFVIRGLATLDPNNRINENDRIPIRAHMNVGYRFDNSANLVEELETRPPPAGRGTRVSRIERFGLDINRTDFFEIGFGAEYVHAIVRPFLEWTIDAPMNRQEYTCNVDEAAERGESCLKLQEGFGIAPSRFTIGARVFPWEGRGLSALAAFDIGTGATSNFIEEVAPELPWNLWIGLAYAVDTEPPKPIIQRVEAPVRAAPPPVENFIVGSVKERGTETPVPNAIVRYDGRPLTGMVANEQGSFRTMNLPPGTYTFSVSAPGYRDGQCTATIPTTENTPRPAGAPRVPTGPERDRPMRPAKGSSVQVTCELEALPRVGNVSGMLVDGEGGGPVASARIKIVDKLGRALDLQGDASGQFRFENVPPGRAQLTIEAPGYFTNTTEVTVRSREDTPVRITLNKRPTQPNVVVQGNEVKLKKQVHFQTDSAEILPDSMALLEEIADVIKSRPDIGSIEVQGHTDNTGTPPHNQRLSQNRAQAVVTALERLGVQTGRLTAKGYGQDKPLVPNVTEPNRARNRRVQLIIQK